MRLRELFLVAVISLAAVNADVGKIDHDQVQPFAQPKPTTDSEKSAVKYKPQLHISYGCHSVGDGLKWSGWTDGDCKGSGLGSQVYSRSDWYKDKWAITYAWYFPEGSQFQTRFDTGHRHFWSYAIVWTDNSNSDNSTILGVSRSANLGYEKKAPSKSKYVVDGKTAKLNSYVSFWIGTQAIQLTTKSGKTQDLITWEQLTDEVRDALKP